ncbi:MAG: metallophosphoesterase family protein [Gaiellales bacterium]
MRVAALYDIHANLPALEAVLAEPDVAGADLVVVGGDALAGPMPIETLALLTILGDRAAWVHGNTEREVARARGGNHRTGELWGRRAAWVAGRLTAPDIAAAERWPATVTIAVDGLGPVCFCHGSPRGDEEIITAISPSARVAPMLAGVGEQTIVCGHTHVQFDRIVAGKRLVNAGSVGMPYEDSPGARWCLLGPGVELRRTAYDTEAAAVRIRATEFPDAAEFAADLLEPASAERATREFEAQAGAKK